MSPREKRKAVIVDGLPHGMDQSLVSNESILLLIRKCRSPIWMFARYTNLRCKTIYVSTQATNRPKVKVLPLLHVGEHFWHLAMRPFHSHRSPILRAFFGLVPCCKQCHGSHHRAAVGKNGAPSGQSTRRLRLFDLLMFSAEIGKDTIP